jgi:hypothetical protein
MGVLPSEGLDLTHSVGANRESNRVPTAEPSRTLGLNRGASSKPNVVF